jgi:hypothetical protein
MLFGDITAVSSKNYRKYINALEAIGRIYSLA